MRKLLVLIALTALVVMLPAASFAAATYVVTEDENTSANTATVFSLNPTTGVLTQVKVLKTGGTALVGGFLAATTEAIAQTANCVFVADTGSNDIAAFSKATGYAKVGNFSNSALNWSNNFAGGSIALSPNGSFLYGAYSGSQNIGAWSVAANCTLTFVNAYVPSTGGDLFATLKVTPDGNDLIVPSLDNGVAVEFSINQTSGALTEVGNVSWNGFSVCIMSGCFPFGLDITGDSKLAVFGNSTLANDGKYALSANISTAGLSNPQIFTLNNSANVGNSTTPVFSAQSYPHGDGGMLFNMSGYFSPVENSGVVAAVINSTGPTVKVVGSTLIATPNTSCGGCTGSLRIHGNLAVIAVLPNLINVYNIDAATGALTLLKSNIDANATSLVSLDVYPNTR